LLHAGAPEIQLVNRSLERARALAQDLGPPVTSLSPDAAPSAIARAKVIINATPAAPDIPLDAAGPGAVVMDMVYRPLVTSFLARASALGLVTVDGLAMLIGQAKPSFTALFETPVPEIDVRGLALAALSEGS
jgi:shikimate dehydrogenase